MKRPWIIGGAVVIAGVLAYLIFGGLRENVVFFLTPQELLAKGTEGIDVPVRLGGQVKPGSRVWDPQTLDLQFVVQDTVGGQMKVKSTGSPPQMFREGIGVILEGRLGRDSIFHATSLMVKHSNEYRAPGSPHDTSKKTLMKPTP